MDTILRIEKKLDRIINQRNKFRQDDTRCKEILEELYAYLVEQKKIKNLQKKL